MSSTMKDSGSEWIGKIPENWDVTKFKYVMKKEKVICKKYINENILSLTKSGVIIRDLESPTGKMPATFDGYQYVNRGDVLLCLFDIDVTPRCVGIVKDNGITSPAYSRYHLKKDNSLRYYNYLLTYIDDNKILLSFTKSLRNTLTDEYFGVINTLSPSLVEQQKIANFLDEKTSHINSIIEDTKQSIEEFKKYKQALITETVTKGLNSDAEMKNSGIDWVGEIPEGWEILRLKDVSSLNDETISDSTSEKYNFKYIDIGSVSLERGIYKRELMNINTAPSRARRIVRHNDVIISTVRTYLKAITTIPNENDLIVSTGFAVIRPRSVNSQYLSYYVKSDVFTEKVRAHSYGVAYPSINASQIMSFKILKPSIKEQQQIAEYLDEKTTHIDSLIENKISMVSQLEEYKKSMIYEYVTGKKEVE